MNNGNEFSRLKKEKRAWCEKNHGKSKEEEEQNILKKIVPLASYRKFRNIKTKEKNPVIPREIVYHIENNQDYIDTTFSNSCNRCKKKIQ